MATFIATIQVTEQGSKTGRDTCKRVEAFQATAQKMGVQVTGIYWTLDALDGLIVCEAPDEVTATTALRHLGSPGKLRTQTVRALDAAERQKVLGLLPERPRAAGQVSGQPRRLGTSLDAAAAGPHE
jgi:uncharacterized protein with GYD domain